MSNQNQPNRHGQKRLDLSRFRHSLNLKELKVCPECNGDRFMSGSFQIEECQECFGLGFVRKNGKKVTDRPVQVHLINCFVANDAKAKLETAERCLQVLGYNSVQEVADEKGVYEIFGLVDPEQNKEVDQSEFVYPRSMRKSDGTRYAMD